MRHGISHTDTLIWDSNNEKMSTINPVMITTEENDAMELVLNQTQILKWKILKPSRAINKANYEELTQHLNTIELCKNMVKNQ